MSGLYGHSQELARALPLIEQGSPPYWKAIDPDPVSARRCTELGTRLLVRHFVDTEQWARLSTTDPAGAAATFRQECRTNAWYAHAWAVETPNEPIPFSHPGLPAYVEFEAECVRLFREDGKPCVVNNFGTGQDGHLVPGAEYYGAHEYGWPNLLTQAPEHALRYRSWFAPILTSVPSARLFITECGVTRALVQFVPPGTDFEFGWRSDGRSAEQYWSDSLAPYLAEIRKDAFVLGAFIFQVGGFAPWATFEVLGTSLEDHLIDAGRVVASVSDFGPGLLNSHRHQFDAWWAAGGWRNFAGFLAATDQLEVTPAQRRELALDRLESAVAETRSFINTLDLG